MIGLRKALKKVLGRAPAGPAEAPVGPASPPAQQAPAGGTPAATEKGEDLPWYLQGEDRDAGWDATNPGTDPEKKNLTEK